MRKLLAPFALALALVVTPAFAETMTHSVAKISFEVPKNWKAKKDGEALTLKNKADDIEVAFLVVDAGALKKATKALDKSLKQKIKNLKWEEEKKVEIHGMKGVALGGDGEIDGKDVDILVVILDTPAEDKDLIVLGVGEDETFASHKAEVKGIFASLKPTE